MTIKNRRQAAISQASHWLDTVDSSSVAGLVELGLLVRMLALDELRDAMASSFDPVSIDEPLDLLILPPKDVLNVLNRLYSGAYETCSRAPTRDQWAYCLSILAMATAQAQDLALLSVILRTAGRLRLRSPALDFSEQYLLEQQDEDGAFRMPVSMPHQPERAENAKRYAYRLTVDVLWALAERQRSEGAGGVSQS